MSQNKISIPSHILALILLFFFFCPLSANADEKSDMERLDAIQTISDRDNEEGLRQLQDFKSKQTNQTTDTIRLETFKILVSLYFDAGKIKLAEATIAEFLDFAEKHQNKDAIALAQISKSLQILDDGKPEVALVKLKEIQESIKNNKDPDVNLRLNLAMGAVYNIQGKFEQALAHYLETLRLSDLLPRRKLQTKISRLSTIANLYWNMKDPEKCLATANEALALSSSVNSPKIVASLSNIQGIALSNLGRSEESLEAYKRELKIGIEANIPNAEATALSNISDYYLIAKDYRKAEYFSRKTIGIDEAVADKPGVATAKMNLGFALMGQGKIKEGVDYVNSGLNFYKDSHSTVEVESAIGEFASMYEKVGMYKEAYATLREQQTISNELFRSDRAIAVAGLQEKFSADQRQKQIELLGKENALKDADIRNSRLQQIITLLGAIVTVMGGIFIFLLYRRVRKVNEQLQNANKQLEFHAVRDPLTGLYNRRSFLDLMKSRVVLTDDERREGGEQNPDCLILMDIDLFKHINDTWGHSVGDVVLTEVAKRLKSAVRDTDMVLRWGGEEFLIYSPKSNPAQISVLVDRVLCAIGSEVIQVGELQIPVTITAGFISLPFSGVPENVCGWEKALQMADMALYLGKAHGRNRACGMASLLVPYEQAIPVLDHDLSAAIADGMVELIEVIGPVQAKKLDVRETKI
jgi:diguanylate cyclase (GGDEF)-like protein